MNRTLIKTEDGSHSLFVAELNEHYHSTHGALQESRHVFIEAGLRRFHELYPGEPIRILEIGLGTGLNALLTLIEAEKLNLDIRYTALEAFPVETDIVQQLNYASRLSADADAVSRNNNAFQLLHTAPWERETAITNYFRLYKIKSTLQDASFSDNSFNLIYFDAFGPPVQPEMWTEQVFQQMHDALQTNGILVTYCAKGEVKRNMKKAGFTIERLQGPPGKREMTRATKF